MNNYVPVVEFLAFPEGFGYVSDSTVDECVGSPSG